MVPRHDSISRYVYNHGEVVGITCTACATVKPPEEFSLNQRNKVTGRQGLCKPCALDYAKRYRKMHYKSRVIARTTIPEEVAKRMHVVALELGMTPREWMRGVIVRALNEVDEVRAQEKGMIAPLEPIEGLSAAAQRFLAALDARPGEEEDDSGAA